MCKIFLYVPKPPVPPLGVQSQIYSACATARIPYTSFRTRTLPYPYQNIKINKRWMRCTGYFADNWLSNWIRNFTTVTQKIQSVTTTNLEIFLKNRTLLDNEISQLNGLVAHCGAISATLNTQIYMCNNWQKATG